MSRMLDQVVSYLRSHGASFRVSSHSSPVPPGGLVVETQVLLVGGRAAIACMARGAKLNLPRLRYELGVDVLEGTPADLPPPYSRAAGWIPPLGGAMSAPTIVDEQVSLASAIVFAAFVPSDHVELPYDEFARLERPRIASFAMGGELPEGHEEEEIRTKVA